MQIVAEFAFPEDNSNTASAEAVGDWLRHSMETLDENKRASATVVLFFGDSSNYLRLCTN